jgi:hypothetical protein
MVDSPPAQPPLQEESGASAPVSLSAWVLIALAVAVASVLALSTGSKPQRPVPLDPSGAPCVGAEAFYTLLLPRGDVVAAPQTDNAPLFVRIKSIQPAENQQFSYLVAYSGIEKGTFNLTDYLCKPNGERLRTPITPVQVNSYISDSAEYAIQNLPVPRHPTPLPYTTGLLLSAAAWLGSGLWLFLPRGARRKPVAPAPPQPRNENAHTLEGLLRPLVERAAKKTITPQEKACMEQILFQYWGALLQLDHLNSVEQLRRILEHKEAGALLRTVEEWLYQPDSKIEPEEINQILKPYMDLPISTQTPPAHEEPALPELES